MQSTFDASPNLRQQRMRDAARALWLEHGYRTSMDAVAKRAGCSKQTVYAHFGSKEGLFSRVIQDLIAPQLATLEVTDADDLESALLRFAQSHTELRALPESVARRQLLVGEAKRHPDEAQALLRAGIDVILKRLSSTIDHAMRDGKLRRCDADIASELFIGLLYGAEIERELLGHPTRVSAVAREQWAQHAVSSFMTIYSVSNL